MKDLVSVFKVPPQVLGEHLAVYLVQFGQILSVTSDDLNGGWSFEIMLDHLHHQLSGCKGPENVNQYAGREVNLWSSYPSQQKFHFDQNKNKWGKCQRPQKHYKSKKGLNCSSIRSRISENLPMLQEMPFLLSHHWHPSIMTM